MDIFPFRMKEVMRLYNRVSKLRPSTILEKEQGELQDVVSISAEAKKRQILAQARSEVLERIRDVK